MWKRFLLWLGKAIVTAAAAEAARTVAREGAAPAPVDPATIAEVLKPPAGPRSS